MESSSLLINRSDISPISESWRGLAFLSETLNQCSDQELVNRLSQFIHYNSVFGAGVANLAGEIAQCQSLFKDKNETGDMVADQSVEVASRIFFAAIDEFGRDKTHRTMAKETLKALMQYYCAGFDTVHIAKDTQIALKQVKQGYCLNQTLNEIDLFHSLGFHMGSELLADAEFNIIDQILQKKWPNLVQYLKENNAYTWIQVHTKVEADHFEAAVASANCALQYYSGAFSSVQAKKWIIEGINNFARVQERFMSSLTFPVGN